MTGAPGQTVSSHTPLVVDLAAASRIADVGGKAHALQRLFAEGVDVPPGFVLTTTTFEHFGRAIGAEAWIAQLAKAVRAGDLARLRTMDEELAARADGYVAPAAAIAAIEQAYAALGASHDDATVAVRSSATIEDGAARSFAGVLRSCNGVRGIDLVERAVRTVLASGFASRVGVYLARQQALELLADVRVAVLVQVEVPPLRSGVLFTRHPRVTGEAMLCEYVSEGEASVVGGGGIPRSATLERSGSDWRSDEAESLLTTSEWAWLARAGARCEAVFGVPQDIEWVQDSSKRFWIVQSRPITGLS